MPCPYPGWACDCSIKVDHIVACPQTMDYFGLLFGHVQILVIELTWCVQCTSRPRLCQCFLDVGFCCFLGVNLLC